MKKTLASLVVSSVLTGCLGGTSFEEHIENARNCVDEGKPKTVLVHASPSDLGSSYLGPEISYHDADGDNKTVEQYIRKIQGVGTPIYVDENFVRKGHDGFVVCGVPPTIMTEEQQEKFDREYQSLLKMYDHIDISE